MAEHGGGSIINTTSIAALERRRRAAHLPHLEGRGRRVQPVGRDRPADHGIRVNCIAPGHIATGITNYDMGPVIRLTQPLQRHGSPDDVANAVLYLAGDRSAQVTGIVLPVDGGTVAGPARDAAAGPDHGSSKGDRDAD